MAEKKIRIACRGAEVVDIESIIPTQGNLADLEVESFELGFGWIKKYGFTAAIHVWEDEQGKLHNIDGHQRQRILIEARKRGWTVPKVPIVYVKAKNYQEAREIVLTHASQLKKVNPQGLYEFVSDLGLTAEQIPGAFRFPDIEPQSFVSEFFVDGLPGGNSGSDSDASEGGKATGALADRFLIPPFSVLNAREGWWQDRKRQWIALGIKSELGRGGVNGGGGPGQISSATNTPPVAGAQERRSAGAQERSRKQLQESSEIKQTSTLGAVAPNQKQILKRTGAYGKVRSP